jgi:hypothetical protein
MKNRKPKFRALISQATTGLFLMVTALSMTLMPESVMAKKPVCPGTHPTCDDDDGGTQFTVTPSINSSRYILGITEVSVDNDGDPANSSDLNLNLALPRECVVGNLYPIDGSGSYECEAGGKLILGNVLKNNNGVYPPRKWHQIAKNGDDRYCDLLGGNDAKFRTFSPTRFWYHNHSGCDFTEGGVCNVGVSQWVYRGTMNGGGETGDTHQYFDLDGLDDIGLIGIGAQAEPQTVEGEGNIFATSPLLGMLSISVTFKLAGKNKTIAKCQATAGIDFTLGDLQFDTESTITDF